MTITYGNHSNEVFAIQYFFIPKHNPIYMMYIYLQFTTYIFDMYAFIKIYIYIFIRPTIIFSFNTIGFVFCSVIS